MDFSKDLSVAILAAGKGKRMKSEIPKVLHEICGQPIIYYILSEVSKLNPGNVYIIIGHGRDLVKSYLRENFPEVNIVVQDRQLGTAHAIQMVKAAGGRFGNEMLVLSGDSPLITSETLLKLIDARSSSKSPVSVLTSTVKDPSGYGRVVKDGKGNILKIIEEADAGPGEKKINEVNSSAYCFETGALFENIDKINTKNKQEEYYLTDIIGMFIEKGHKVSCLLTDDHLEAMGINDRFQLSLAEKVIQHRISKRLMEGGVTIKNPGTTYIEEMVTIGSDTIIEPSSILKGKTKIGKGSLIGPFSQITDSEIGQGSTVNASVIIGSKIGANNNIGPNSYIRPLTVTGENVKIGAFCEVKKSQIAHGSKVPHLSYIGDTEIGSGVNIGASTVTVNYDGFLKNRTIIEDNVFIGSDTMLIAPVKIGKGAIVAAGSVVSRDVPPDSMAIERGKQKNIKNGAVKYKKRKHDQSGR